MAPTKRPRLIDLAAKLDIAPSTVSRALAGSQAVSAATRDRVRRAAREMGYAVNPAASALKRGHTLNIGLIAVTSYWYSGAVTSGADRVAATHGYDFVVMNAVGGTDRDLLLARARRLGLRVDGALVVDIANGDLLDDVIAVLGVPAVTIGCQSANAPSVLVDNHEIGQLAARHLQSLGHKTAAVLSPFNPSTIAFDNTSVRSAGFVEAFDAPVVPVTLAPSSGSERQRMICQATSDVTSVFCTTDALAIETVASLRESGRPVPDEVSVVGVDDHPLAEPLGLTTVAQTPETMGETAASMVLGMINGAPGSSVASEHGDIGLVRRRTTSRANQ